ncbi:MAG: hypothetical protein ACREMV_13025 [Gemmatimonadales bacterium]
MRLVGLRDESLVAQRADTSFGVPVRQITELELVRKSIKQVGAGGREVFGALEGAGDEVYQLTLLDRRERRRIIERILLDHRAKTTSVASPAGGLIRGA